MRREVMSGESQVVLLATNRHKLTHKHPVPLDADKLCLIRASCSQPPPLIPHFLNSSIANSIVFRGK